MFASTRNLATLLSALAPVVLAQSSVTSLFVGDLEYASTVGPNDAFFASVITADSNSQVFNLTCATSGGCGHYPGPLTYTIAGSTMSWNATTTSSGTTGPIAFGAYATLLPTTTNAASSLQAAYSAGSSWTPSNGGFATNGVNGTKTVFLSPVTITAGQEKLPSSSASNPWTYTPASVATSTAAGTTGAMSSRSSTGGAPVITGMGLAGGALAMAVMAL